MSGEDEPPFGWELVGMVMAVVVVAVLLAAAGAVAWSIATLAGEL